MKQGYLQIWLGTSVALLLSLISKSTTAQIVQDGTLPVNSVVTPLLNTSLIEGGTARGSNLFHSFKEFSIPSGNTAYFNNSLDITNILTRVTGGSISSIDGVIKANGIANLFLINPNGIVFGKDARLDIGGSFIATSAWGMKFGDGFEFNAKNPQSSPLLSINVPTGLQFGENPASITVQDASLEVSPGKVLGLIGGNVSIEGGKLIASGGRVELGGLAALGIIDLEINSLGSFQLSFPVEVRRSDLELSNGAQALVTGTGGGSIFVNTRNLDILQGSSLNAGIANSEGIDAGDINVNATGDVTLNESSLIENIVNSGSIGNAGKINIVANSLNLLTGSQLFSSTFAKGNGGDVNVRATNAVSLDSAGNNTSISGIISSVANTGEGKAGDINITSGVFSVSNGAQINSITLGKGNAGNVNIRAESTASFDGSNVGASGIISAVATGGVGKGGDIGIDTGSLSVTNGAQLNAITRGEGDAGNVNITARDRVVIDGENKNSNLDPYAGVSSIFTSVGVDDNGKQARGNGGNLNITTGSLLMTNGAQLNAITRGRGDAGNVNINASDRVFLDGERRVSTTRAATGIYSSVDGNEYSGFPELAPAIGNGGDITITTGSLSILNGAELNALTKGQGNAGNVNITARDKVTIDGENTNKGASGVYSSVDANLYTNQPPAIGNGGDVQITTESLAISRGGGVFATTAARGNAGNVTIAARDQITIDGENTSKGASGIYSSVDGNLFTQKPPAIGNGGDIKIESRSLLMTNGAGVFATTGGQGNAGNVSINARQVLLDGFSNSGNFTSVLSDVKANAVGNGQNINIVSSQFTVSNGARVSTSSIGNGAAGNIDINANSILLDKGIFSSDTVAGEGNITLRSQLSILRRGSNITTNATGKNIIGGNININTDLLAAFENSDISANSQDFRGGNVKITTQGIFGTQLSDVLTLKSDITATGANSSLDGNVEINRPDIDPTSGLLELPNDFSDRSNLIVQGCPAFQGNSFTITGKGGLPANPQDLIRSNQTATIDWVTPNPIAGKQAENLTSNNQKQQSTKPSKIIEANNWVVNKSGEVMLIASTANTLHQSGFISTPKPCPSDTNASNN